MALGDVLDAFDGELFFLFVLGTFAIASFGSSSSTSLSTVYKTSNRPRWAPPSMLFGLVWTVLYTLSGIAAYLVRVIGGHWTTNTRALVLYIVLQVVLALYVVFASRKWYWTSAFIVLASLVLCIIVTIQFAAFSTTAATFMGLECGWLLFALILQVTVASMNSEGMLRKAVRFQSTAETQQKARVARLKRSTGFSDGPAKV
jgi:benzodiazapine receptor